MKVVSKEKWEEMLRLKAAGQNLSAIARQMGLARKTVRRWLKKAEWAPYRRGPGAPKLLDAHLAWL
ncbi:MAG: IS21 family transposase, partial [Azospira oryzae]